MRYVKVSNVRWKPFGCANQLYSLNDHDWVGGNLYKNGMYFWYTEAHDQWISYLFLRKSPTSIAFPPTRVPCSAATAKASGLPSRRLTRAAAVAMTRSLMSAYEDFLERVAGPAP